MCETDVFNVFATLFSFYLLINQHFLFNNRHYLGKIKGRKQSPLLYIRTRDECLTMSRPNKKNAIRLFK